MSHLDDPMIPEDYGSPEMTRDMTLGWDVPRIAADRELVLAVLKEYMVRLLFENELIAPEVAELVNEATFAALTEYYASKIVKESESG